MTNKNEEKEASQKTGDDKRTQPTSSGVPAGGAVVGAEEWVQHGEVVKVKEEENEKMKKKEKNGTQELENAQRTQLSSSASAADKSLDQGSGKQKLSDKCVLEIDGTKKKEKEVEKKTGEKKKEEATSSDAPRTQFPTPNATSGVGSASVTSKSKQKRRTSKKILEGNDRDAVTDAMRTQESSTKIKQKSKLGLKNQEELAKDLIRYNEDTKELLAGKSYADAKNVYYTCHHSAGFVAICANMGIAGCEFLLSNKNLTIPQKRKGMENVFLLLVRLKEMFGTGSAFTTKFNIGNTPEIRAKFVDGVILVGFEEYPKVNIRKGQKEIDAPRTKPTQKQDKLSYYEVTSRVDKNGDSWCDELALNNKKYKKEEVEEDELSLLRRTALKKIRVQTSCKPDAFESWLQANISTKTQQSGHDFVHNNYISALIDLEMIYEHLFERKCHECFCCITSGKFELEKLFTLLQYVVDTANQRRTAYTIKEQRRYNTNAKGYLPIQIAPVMEVNEKLDVDRVVETDFKTTNPRHVCSYREQQNGFYELRDRLAAAFEKGRLPSQTETKMERKNARGGKKVEEPKPKKVRVTKKRDGDDGEDLTNGFRTPPQSPKTENLVRVDEEGRGEGEEEEEKEKNDENKSPEINSVGEDYTMPPPHSLNVSDARNHQLCHAKIKQLQDALDNEKKKSSEFKDQCAKEKEKVAILEHKLYQKIKEIQQLKEKDVETKEVQTEPASTEMTESVNKTLLEHTKCLQIRIRELKANNSMMIGEVRELKRKLSTEDLNTDDKSENKKKKKNPEELSGSKDDGILKKQKLSSDHKSDDTATNEKSGEVWRSLDQGEVRLWNLMESSKTDL